MLLYQIFLVLLGVSALTTGGLAAIVLRRAGSPGALPLAVMLGGQSFWAVGYMVELLVPGLEAKIFWDNLQFTGADIAAMASLIFALCYTGRRLTSRVISWLLGVLALIDAVMVWSDPLHGLVRPEASLSARGAFLTLEYSYGPWFWVFALYALLLPLAALLLLAAYTARLHLHYRLQAAAITAGVSLPLVGGLLTAFGAVPIMGMEHLDITPFSTMLAVPILAWGLFRQRLLDLVPVARARLIEQLSDGLVVADAQLRVVDVNVRALNLLGYGRDLPLGRPLVELLPQIDELPPLLKAAPSRLIRVERPGRITIDLEITATPLALRNQRADGWMLVLRDVTARRQAERALQSAQSRLEFLLEQAPTVIFSATGRPHYRTTYISPNIFALTGYSPRDFTEHPGFWKEQIHPDDLPGFLGGIPQIFAQGHGEQEYRFRCADGAYRWMQSRVRVVRDMDGQFVEVIGSWIDVSEQKAHETQLHALLASQEVLLKEVHHRVKNNLQVIISLLRLQADGLPPGEPKELLRDTQHRVRAMAMIHEHLYGGGDLSHLKFATYTRNLATTVLRSYSTIAGQIKLQIDIPDDLCLTLDQAVPLGLILAELLSNSFKHAFPEGRRGILTITLDRQAETALITVGDDGVGLPENLVQRSERSLGLQLVRRLAFQIKGELHISNSPGATFAITFPLALP